MAKDKTKLTKIDKSVRDQMRIEEEIQSNEDVSKRYMKEVFDDADEKEELLLGSVNDKISTGAAKSRVFDPRLSTIVFERASRVMSQEHTGHAYADSKSDVGKNKMMDMLLGYYTRCANRQYSMMVKMRMMSLYSNVYGSMYALTPWTVDLKKDYMGPGLEIIPFKNVRPQPVVTLNDADWFGVHSWVTLNWLKQQNREVWQNLDAVIDAYKDTSGDEQDNGDDSSYPERDAHPDSRRGTKSNPLVHLYTEYQLDRWVTLAMRPLDNKKVKWGSRVVRIVESQLDGLLPIIEKVTFPVLGRSVGFGEFERLGTLAKATNSLWNLYLDGVKMGIFPPKIVNPAGDNLVRSSLVNSPGATWLGMAKDIQMVNVNPSGIQTFTSTYGAMIGAIMSAAGTSSTVDSDNVQTTMGKTPQAIQYMQQRESARDNWEQKMVEQMIQDIYTRWIGLSLKNQERPVVERIYGKELAEIQKSYPDVVEMFESGDGRLEINKDMFTDETTGDPVKYDYRVEAGSTIKPDPIRESQMARELLEIVLKNPQLPQQVQAEGKTIVYSELLDRAFASSGIQGYDKIVVDNEQAQEQEMPGSSPEPTVPAVDPNEFNDPDIRSIATQMFGGIGGIPAVNEQ